MSVRQQRPPARATLTRHALACSAGIPLGAAPAGRPASAPAGPAAALVGDRAQLPRVTPAVRALAGCYRLTTEPAPGLLARVRAWWRSGPPLPPVVHLDTAVRRTYARGADFRAGPDVTDSHEFSSAPGWRLGPPDSLVVSWFDGFAGTTLRLRRAGAAWRGVARYTQDTGPDDARPANVVATRVACGS